MNLHSHRSIVLPVLSFYPITEKEVNVEETKEGKLLVGYAETKYQVNYCPICGYEAKLQIK